MIKPTILLLTLLPALADCSGSRQQAQASSAPAAPATAPEASAVAATVAPATTAAPVASASATPSANPLAAVTFTDIAGIFAETAIKQEAALGIFGSTTGAFNPYGTLSRARYVQWLVTANNAYFKSAADKQLRLAESDSDQTFLDLPKSNPYFKYVQAMANAGFVVGIDKDHFAPDRPLTREEMIAILNSRELNGAAPVGGYITAVPTQFTDGGKVAKPYWGLINYDASQPGYEPGFGNIPRIFGSIKVFHPQRPVTRAEAAVALALISNGKPADVLPQ